MKKLFMILAILVSLFMVSGPVMAGSATADADAAADVEITFSEGTLSPQTIEEGSTVRQFVNPGVTPLPMTNGFFTAPTPDSSFKSIRDIINALHTEGGSGHIRLNEAALIQMAKGGKVTTHTQVVRGITQVPRAYERGPYKDIVTGEDMVSNRFLIITIEKPIVKDGKVVGMAKPPGIKVTGFIDGEAKDGKTNSLQVLGKVGLTALEDGNNLMVITAEGAHRMVEASGWGVGFYGVTAGVSEAGKASSLAGGGTGYAKNKTGTEDKPWVQGYIGVAKDIR